MDKNKYRNFKDVHDEYSSLVTVKEDYKKQIKNEQDDEYKKELEKQMYYVNQRIIVIKNAMDLVNNILY